MVLYKNISEIEKGFKEALLFADYELKESDLNSLSVESNQQISQIVFDFYRDNMLLIESAVEYCVDHWNDYSYTDIGRDLYFTLNSHGVGFWCREKYLGSEYSELLNKAVKVLDHCEFNASLKFDSEIEVI